MSVFRDITSPIRFFRRLQTGGLSRWRAANRNKLLCPFAWIYQIGFIVSDLIRNKVTITEMFKMYQNGLQQRELFNRLGLSVSRIDP